MMGIRVVSEAEPYRLISDGAGRFAVIEARNGHVYSLHGRHRHEATDDDDGMARVVGDGWRSEMAARRRFRSMCRTEERYGKVIW